MQLREETAVEEVRMRRSLIWLSLLCLAFPTVLVTSAMILGLMELASPLVQLEPTELEVEREALLQAPLETPNLPVELADSRFLPPVSRVVSAEGVAALGDPTVPVRTEVVDIQVEVLVAGVVVQTTVRRAQTVQAAEE
jgi:hypothetical protein